MPGIVGIFAHGNAEAMPAKLERMLGSMHRSAASRSGTHFCAKTGACVGWVAHPNSFADGMPKWNEDRTVALVLTGEEYAEASDFDDLRGRGHRWSGNGADYLVHMYEERGLEFLARLNGRYAGIIFDHRRREAILFNDRYGLGRIYIHEREGILYFATEAKALMRACPDLRTLDAVGAGEWWSCGCVLGDRTLFQGISLLPGGSRWVSSGSGALKRDRYFRPDEWERQAPIDAVEFPRELETTFRRVLPRYLRQSDDLAMSLTGGLDGRMVMAWADAKPGQLPCYTFGGEYRDCADVRIARRIASACRQEHRTIPVGREFCEEFPSLAEETVRISDGAMDVSGAVELYANRVASTIAPTRLTGNYGSEIVRGNVAFGSGSVDSRLPSRDLMQSVETAAATYRLARQCSDLSFIAFKQVPWYHYARLSVEQSQLTPRSPFLDNDLVALMFRAPPSLISSRVPTLRVIGNGNPRLLEIPTDRGTWQVAPTPWCRMRSFVNELTVKAEYAWDYGMPAWLAGVDRMLAPWRPERLFLGRHKFYHFRVWYRDRLGDYLRDVLLDPRSLARPYLDARRAEEIVRQHLEGRANWTEELHRMLTFELLHRAILEES